MVGGALAALAVAACSGSTANDARSLDTTNIAANIAVSSPQFTNNGAIPRANTCDGTGTPPALLWHRVPAVAKSVAVVVDDPDAPRGPFVHWIVIGLQPRDGSLPASGPDVHQLDNTGGTRGWAPPCPPAGAAHHYRFTVYALRDYVCASDPDSSSGPGCAEPSAAEALNQIRDAAIAKGTLIGTYQR